MFLHHKIYQLSGCFISILALTLEFTPNKKRSEVASESRGSNE